MSKPDWKDAPEWAQWAAMDDTGHWYWYEQKPDWDEEEQQWDAYLGRACRVIDGVNTLERRP